MALPPIDDALDPTPGIVSVWADPLGRATVWRREAKTRAVIREDARFRPWVVLDRLDDLRHLGVDLGVEGTPGARATYHELSGSGALRYLVRTGERGDGRSLAAAIRHGASQRLGRPIAHIRELGKASILSLAPEEQYLVASGRSYFGGLTFDDLRRLQFDLETTGLDPEHHRVFLIAVRDPEGATEILEAAGEGDAAEAALIRRLVARVRAADPDVIENHNLHGFDLPFLETRARCLGVSLALARLDGVGVRRRPARHGFAEPRPPAPDASSFKSGARYRFTIPGREVIDTLDAVMRHDFSARELPGYGLKAVARHFGLARDDRELIPGDRIYQTYRRDPDRVRRYAGADVEEAAGLARLLGGAAFALAALAPRRYERLAEAGAATGIIDPLLVRTYLRAGEALPAHEPGDGTPHSGAALELYAAGVARHVVKADVASLYPSLMRAHRIGPERDRLGALLSLVDALVIRRLDAKAQARRAPEGSSERHALEAISTAMKLVVNSAYGYLAAGGLTRFADVHAANEVTRRGREVLALMCRELAARGVTLLEADTDGVYFAVPDRWTEADERRVVAEVASLLPPLVQLELDGRYQAMLSHEPKNYALLTYDGRLILHGVAFRSSRSEPFGQAFLRAAIDRLLYGDVAGVRDAYVTAVRALRDRRVGIADVATRVRLTRTPEEYQESRESRHELAYEALLTSGHASWTVGDRVRVYRTASGGSALVDSPVHDAAPAMTPDRSRDYDADFYVRQLRTTFAARLARAFTTDGFAAVFDDPDQPSLFAADLSSVAVVLTTIGTAAPDRDRDS